MRGVTKPLAERIPDDAYLTPPELATAICVRLGHEIPYPDYGVWDPCCGDDPVFAKAASVVWNDAHVTGTDLTTGDDFLTPVPNLPATVVHSPSLIVSNPPYLLAEQFVRRALLQVRPGGHVAFLLRLSFLAGVRRRTMYVEHPLRFLIPIIPRPSFTPDGKTDAAEYAVFVWQRPFGPDRSHEPPHRPPGVPPPIILPPIVWR